MPKDQSREKKPRHFTCLKCLKPSKRLIKYGDAIPQTIEFSTSDGLDKHLREEHRSTMYSCTAVGCFKGTSVPKFQKPETLTQHIKELHRSDTIYSCPMEGCSFGPCHLDHLVIHAHWTHTIVPSEVHERARFQRGCRGLSSFMNAATWQYFRCPVWDCRKFVSGGHRKVSAHLLAHLPIELENVRDELAFDGYEIYNSHGLVALSSALRASSVQIKCPACEVRCESDADFRHHIEATHMLARFRGALEHFETWRKDIESWTVKQRLKKASQRPCWLESVPDSVFYQVSRSRETSRKCSYSTCPFQVWKGGEDHPSFLRTAGEIATDLWPHRMEILRHYPRFITHPLFQE
jgi:hypothetical protein